MPMQPIFLAHSSTDKAFVRRLAGDLRQRGVPVWFDEWEIRVGDSIVTKISEGIKSAGWLAVILSEASVNSEWVKRELNAGLMTELEARRVCVLPIRLDGCTVPILLRDKRYADFRADYDSGIRDLLAALQPHLGAAEVESLVKLIHANIEILGRERVDRMPQMEAIETLEGAVSELGRTGNERAVDVLADLLADIYHAICAIPVPALGIASPIGRMWSLVKITIEALGDTGSEKAVDPVIRVLQGKQAKSFSDVCASGSLR